jgi:DNA-binding CsgD family transcriptional regulator
MLVGRVLEQRRIATLLAGARVGQSGTLVLRGEPGIGKTALLNDAVSSVAGMAVLRTSGTEHESGLGFSGLHQLLLPVLNMLERLPAPQRDALAVALTLRSGPAPERFAVAAATLSLVSRYAEERPLLLAVDDAHLLDAASAETLLFVARRLVADPVALLIALRPEPDAILAAAGLPTVELTGLDPSSARSLVTTTRGGSVTTEFTKRLYEATAGNPLALLELSDDPDRITGLPPGLLLPVPDTVARAFGRRVSALSEPARRAALVAAVADGDLTVTALAAAALHTRVDVLTESEAAGLLELTPSRALFRHPLVRAAIYAVAQPDLQRKAHRAVAAALPENSSDLRAWHLSEASVGPDDIVAEALDEVAGRARARGAHSAAMTASERAAHLTSDHAGRGTRLVQAGESAWFAGQVGRADALLSEAAALVDDGAVLAEIEGLRGNLALRTGSLLHARALLQRAAERTESSDPDAAAFLLADVVTACFYMCDTESGLVAAGQLEQLVERCGDTAARIRSQIAIGIARVLAGLGGMEWIRSGVNALTQEPELRDDPGRPDWAVIGTLFLRESDGGRELIADGVQKLRARTAIGALPNLLFHTARDDATTDRWSSAVIGFDESIALARESGQTTDLAGSLAGLAWLEARMGRADQSRAHADEALRLADKHDIVLARLWAMYAAGDLNLAAGDAAAAVESFEALDATLRRIRFRDVDVAPGAELAEAQMRRNDPQATDTAQEYFDRAREKGQPWALARAYRALALTCPDSAERAVLFDQALEFHGQSLDVYEEARTRLAFGAALRRDRARAASRPQLRLALSAFDRLGAQPWADAAARELDATGEHIQRGAKGYLAVLTAQEARIARLLAAGRTTKEAAAELFLSPKTVEYHLRHIYQKLGIGSRSELAAAMGEAD